MLTLVAAYGRKYKSKKAVLADLIKGLDFVIAGPFTHPDCNRYVNLPQLKEANEGTVNVRYGGRSGIDRVAPVNVATLRYDP